MENSGNWFYIILAVIAAFSGILRSANKKKQPTEVLRQPVPLDEDEDWIPASKPHKPSISKSPKRDTGKKAVKKYQPVSSFVTAQVDISEIEASENDVPPVSVEAFQDIEEVKKAIIYSEILNRKY